MNSSKLYSILEHFNKYEQNRLRKYLLSPYFNKNQTLVELFEVLIKNINSKNPKDLSKELIWKKLYGSEKYDDVRFRKYFSDLLKLVEGFLAQQVYEENPLHQATYLIEAVGKMKMEKLYNSTMKTARRLSDQQLHKPASYHFYQYQIEKNFYELAQHELKRGSKSNVELIANHLDVFFLAEKLRIFVAVQTQQHFVSHEYKLLFIDEIISHIEKYLDNYEDIPPVALYYQMYLTTTQSDNHEHYFKLKNLLAKYGLIFPKGEALSIYYSAINYCIRKYNSGNQTFGEELLDLYQDLLNKEIIISDSDGLSPWDFRNIVVVALRQGKYNWTESFIQQYKKYLPESFRENAVSFNLASLYFYQKKYDKLISLLQTVEYEDYSYNLNSKAMLIATYYEIDEIEPLYFLFESFRAYLNRHKDIPLNRRKSFLNLIKFVKKLTKLMPGDKQALKKLKEEIEKDRNIASINWLKEKIAELE